jgi:hypothetical protein
MAGKLLGKFLLQEGLRQDSLVHNTSSQLSTKSGLFMVFAAFIFTAESTLAGFGSTLGLHLPYWPLVIALILALAGIGILLWSARLQNFRMPPVLSTLRFESQRFIQLPDIKDLPEEEQMARLDEKFVNSLARSIAENFEANRRIAGSLAYASALIAISLSCLLLSLLWTVSKHLLSAFPCHHYLGLF